MAGRYEVEGWFSGKYSLFRLFLFFPIAGGLALATATYVQRSHQQYLSKHGHSVLGIIENKRIRICRGFRCSDETIVRVTSVRDFYNAGWQCPIGKRGYCAYEIKIGYPYPGAQRSIFQSVQQSSYDDAQIGQQIEIDVDPAEPRIAQAASAKYRDDVSACQYFLAALIGVPWFAAFIYTIRRERDESNDD